VHLYAQCMKDKPGGVSLLAINLSRRDAVTMRVPEKSVRYTLTATDLLSRTVELNGKELAVSAEGDVPVLDGVKTAKGDVVLPAASLTFLTMGEAGNGACR